MKMFLFKRLNRISYSTKRIARRVKKELNSTYTTYLLAISIGLVLSTTTLFLLPATFFYFNIRRKPRKILIGSTLLIICGFLYSSVFTYNLANLDNNANSLELVIIARYQDYYDGYSLDSNTIVQLYSDVDLNIFSTVKIEGDIKVSKTNAYYSISRNTPFNITPERIEVVTTGMPFITKLKEYILRNLDYNLSRESSNFAKSLVFGDSSYVDKEVKEDFKQIGILHIIALSGYNFILILNLVNSCLFFVDKRKRGLITIPIGIIYLLVAGLTNLSGLRALAFFILATLSNYFGIYINRTKLILMTIVFFLLLNPLNIYSFSLVLSYSAYMGIVIASRIKGNRIKKLVIEQVTVSLFTLPTVALISSSFNILSLVINILLSPVVSLISVILVIAQVLTPILSFSNIVIDLILELTSKLSDLALPVNAFGFLVCLVAIMYIISKMANIIKL